MPNYPSQPGHLSQGLISQRVVYAVPRVDLVGAGQIGAAISAVFSLIPCLLLAWGGATLVSGIRWVLDSWTTASLRIPIPLASVDVPVNYIDLFRLRRFYDSMIYWDDRVWLVFALLFLIPWVFSIISGALYGTALAGIYNAVGKASGGMRVTLASSPLPQAAQPVQPGGWASTSQPGSQPGWQNQPGWPPDQRR